MLQTNDIKDKNYFFQEINAENLINTLDLEVVEKKLCAPYEHGGYQWSHAKAIYAIGKYKIFLTQLYRLKKNPSLTEEEKTLSPTHMVDIVWHTHILFTKKYHADTELIFGSYLHHTPFI